MSKMKTITIKEILNKSNKCYHHTFKYGPDDYSVTEFGAAIFNSELLYYELKKENFIWVAGLKISRRSLYNCPIIFVVCNKTIYWRNDSKLFKRVFNISSKCSCGTDLNIIEAIGEKIYYCPKCKK